MPPRREPDRKAAAERVMFDYARRMAGSNPYARDLIDVAEELAREGRGLPWFDLPPPPPPPPPPEPENRQGQLDPCEAAAALLGVRVDAPKEVIEAAHRALARKFHPDVGGSEEKMKALNKAREELTARNVA